MKELENQKILMVNSGLEEGLNKKIDLKALLYQYILSKWYVYAIFFVISLGLIYMLLLRAEPQYEIKSMVMIREEGKDRSSDQDMLKRSLDFSAVSQNAFNERYMLKSFSSFYEIVEEMDLNVRYYWKNKLSKRQAYKDFPIVVDTFALNTGLGSDVSFDFEIRPTSDESFKFLQDTLISVYRFGQLFSNKYGSFRINTNGGLPFEKNASLHIEFLDSKGVAAGYMENLNVEFTEKNTTVLELTLRDAIPERGVDILMRLIEKYKEQKLKEKNEIALNTLQFINERLGNITTELSQVETSIENYKLQNNITSETTTDLGLVLSNVDRLTDEQEDLQVQLKVLESIRSTFETTKDDYELIPVNLSITNNQLQDLINPYNELVLERRRILTTGGPSNPFIQTTEQKLSSLKRSIYAAVNNLQGDLKMQLGTLENQYGKGVSRLRSVPGKERNLLDKSRQKEYTEKLYLYLLEKKEETALTLIGSSPNFTLIDAPRSSAGAVSPNKKVYYLGGAVVGLGIPFFLIVIISMFKDSVQTLEELKEIIPSQRVAGFILFQKGKKQQPTLASEDFSSLRMDLQFRQKERSKGILVTSSVANEGKTFVAINLALNFANTKMKTVLLDFDLRKPSVSKNLMGRDSDTGLSDYLRGDRTIQEIIQPVEAAPNLDFIPGGPVLSNPMGFLSDEKLNALFLFLKSNYDIIIVDTSPIGIFSDALLLNSYLNYSLFVVRAGFTKKTMVENAGELFEQGKLVNPSIVLNALQVEKIKDYKYYRY